LCASKRRTRSTRCTGAQEPLGTACLHSAARFRKSSETSSRATELRLRRVEARTENDAGQLQYIIASFFSSFRSAISAAEKHWSSAGRPGARAAPWRANNNGQRGPTRGPKQNFPASTSYPRSCLPTYIYILPT